LGHVAVLIEEKKKGLSPPSFSTNTGSVDRLIGGIADRYCDVAGLL